MIHKLYVIKDELEGYHAPVPFRSEELAKRWFITIIEGDAYIKANKKDYSLYYLGEFDDQGPTVFFEEKNVKRIMKGEEYNG